MSRKSPARAARQRLRRWVRKCDADDARGLALPVPTQIISNEEFAPPPQTVEQRRVEQRLTELADGAAKRLGVSRRQFLSTAGGMAAAFAAMNSVFGHFFDVDAAELFEPAASAERWPKDEFIFDIHTHHVAAGRQIKDPPLLRYRDAGAAWGNDALKGREHRWPDLYLANYIKEMFLDSDTVMAVITGLPAKEESQNVLPPAEMIETRAEINGLARSRRIIAHGLFSPELGAKNMEEMQRQRERLRVEAWKGYPGQPLTDGGVGWWMDDERLAYPAYEYSRKVGIKNICVHKGLPLPGWDLEHSSPRDVPKAASDFPDLNFLIYHAGFRGVPDVREAVADGFRTKTYVPWVSDLCEARRRNPKMTNVYMDLGTTFGMTVITQPLLCAHLLGMMIRDFGEDHVLWGTDSIWWGSPQWQIEAFRRLRMPEDLMKRFGYKPLTPEVKRKILGLNSARVYGVDARAKMQAIPTDYVSRLKEKYRAEGARPSNTQYGWIRG
ncbi:MAG TPA: amidohydrolase family protein [Pyrinomonadaceae bacterium]|nr:amidohydrolase family protein [Pyrinomonadaceae bacterium]